MEKYFGKVNKLATPGAHMDSLPILGRLKFGQFLFLCELCFEASQNFRYFFGSNKFSAIFFGLPKFCIMHLNPLNKEDTFIENKKS